MGEGFWAGTAAGGWNPEERHQARRWCRLSEAFPRVQCEESAAGGDGAARRPQAAARRISVAGPKGRARSEIRYVQAEENWLDLGNQFMDGLYKTLGRPEVQKNIHLGAWIAF